MKIMKTMGSAHLPGVFKICEILDEADFFGFNAIDVQILLIDYAFQDLRLIEIPKMPWYV
jgi:hypothetical protein